MDFLVFQKINSFTGVYFWLDALGVFFAKYLIYILAVLIFFIFWKRWKIILLSFLAAVLARFGITELIHFLWEKPRPFVENHVNLLLDKVNQSAFPSGHAAFLFAFSTIIYFYNKKVGILFLIASFFVSLSRVFIGVHWPSDIIAGAIVGIFSGWLVFKLSNRYFKLKN